MNINRRDAIKLGALSVAAVTATSVTGCYGSEATPEEYSAASVSKNVIATHQIVVIGGGFGGLTVAKGLKKQDAAFDVLVIEKNDTFMSCPFSNTYLGKLDGVNLGTFVRDYNQPSAKYGYGVMKTEVVGIDRKAKEIHTTHGVVKYELLVMSPGITYNYESTIAGITQEQIADLKRNAPGALIPGSEHITLERNLVDMEDGDVVITVPSGKFRCPPAPFERACMIAAYMKKEEIKGKVIILNSSAKVAKGAAFKEAWKELYGDRIVHKENCKITGVDTKTKTISYTQEGTSKTHKYEVLNLIANNKANPVVSMSGVETSTAFGKVVMNGCSFRTKTDENIYAVGDVVGHAIPPSGQTAIWAGLQCVQEITHRLHGEAYELPVKSTPQNASNVCFSMVGDKPEEAIRVIHDFTWIAEKNTIKGKGHVPKAANGKFRDNGTAKLTHEWFRGVMGDLFS